jgi:SAM-dependent methyltransferase
MQHAIIKALFGQRNWFAPLKRPKRMLDIGCGTGRWCLEMGTFAAQLHLFWTTQLTTGSQGVSKGSGMWCASSYRPHLTAQQVEGIDLSPIQPDVYVTPPPTSFLAPLRPCLISNSTPANVDFFIDDIRRKEWWHCTQPYDYIHTRMSLGIFQDFREIIQKGFNNLEPGGFMESHEIYPKIYCDDGTMPADYELLEWTRMQDKAAMTLGTPLRIANKLKTWYEQAGFVDVHEETHSIPINSWARDSKFKLLGKFMLWNMCQGVHAWTVEYFARALQWTDVEVEVYLAHLRNAIGDRTVHAYYKV